jgi:LysR family transcriptional regulator, pca operon transcriptional activator
MKSIDGAAQGGVQLMATAMPASDPLFAHLSELSKIKFRHLRCVLEVSREGSLRGAARAMHVTESAASKTLQELEALLQARLFERSREGMLPTEAGRSFVIHARAALETLHSGINTVHGGGLSRNVTLRIGAMPVASATFLSQAALVFMASYPECLLEVSVGTKSFLLARLRQAEIDLVLGRLPSPEDMNGLVFEHCFVDQYVPVVRAGHALAKKETVSLTDLLNLPLLLPPKDTTASREIQRYFLAGGLRPAGALIETVDPLFCMAYACQSDAVWIASERYVREALASGKLCRLAMDSSMLEAPIGLITRAQTPWGTPLRHLISVIRSAADLIPQGG